MRRGAGGKVDVIRFVAPRGLEIEPLAHYFVTGEEQPFHLRGAMSQAYILTCRDGRRIALQLSSPDMFWQGLAAGIGQPDLLAPHPDRKSPVESYDAIGRQPARIFATRPDHERLSRL